MGAVLLFTGAATACAQSCTFQGSPAGISFAPNLDPSAAVVRTAFTNVRIRCVGKGVPPPSSWGFVGLYGTNPSLSLKHSTLNVFIPYSVGNPPSLVSGTGGGQTWRVTATILPASYENANVGAYADSLTISVNP